MLHVQRRDDRNGHAAHGVDERTGRIIERHTFRGGWRHQDRLRRRFGWLMFIVACALAAQQRQNACDRDKGNFARRSGTCVLTGRRLQSRQAIFIDTPQTH